LRDLDRVRARRQIGKEVSALGIGVDRPRVADTAGDETSSPAAQDDGRARDATARDLIDDLSCEKRSAGRARWLTTLGAGEWHRPGSGRLRLFRDERRAAEPAGRNSADTSDDDDQEANARWHGLPA